jgi:hypothetical protein
MLVAGWVRVRPSISYGVPKTVEELLQDGETLFQSVMDEAGRLLADHVHDFRLDCQLWLDRRLWIPDLQEEERSHA